MVGSVTNSSRKSNVISVDLMVIGCGAMGSAALYHAALRGEDVIGIDQFHPPHNLGSSHGQTRVIRQAYFEHPNYVPLILEAYELWHRLERESDRRLLIETGLLEVGPPDGCIVPGVLAAADEHGLPIERLDRKETQQRFSAFRVPDGYEAIFEPRAGYLLVDQCIEAHLAGAQAAGARLAFEERVLDWEATSTGIKVATQTQQFACQRLILAQGAWSRHLELETSLRLRVLRKHLHWFRTQDQRLTKQSNCPMYFYETSDGYFYGFPIIDQRGFKIAEHSGGETISDPSNLDRSLDQQDLARVSAFLKDYVDAEFHHADHEVCMYTMSPDGHFVLDFHAADPRVVIACGFSGHGFKFASVIGRIAVEMAMEGRQRPTTRFLSMKRFRKT